MLDQVQHLVEGGFAVHWLREKSKAPFTDAWSTEPVYAWDDLKGRYRDGYNVGVRLGEPSKVGGLFLQVIDLDIRDIHRADEAYRALAEILPESPSLPTVISGSGGLSRHFYFLSALPFRSKKLAHSVTNHVDAKGKTHWDWEIELFGTGKQVAIPPSIHPDTGLPYVWERAFDFDLAAMGLGPVISSDRVKTWAPGIDANRPNVDDDEEDLASIVHKLPMNLTDAQVHDALYALPKADWCEDRDGWLNVGMALHHQYQASNKGLTLWNEFSARSPKYDAADQERVWKSFRITAKSMRFATLLKAAADARLQAELAAADDDADLLGEDDDDEDLLGEIDTTETDLIGGAPAASPGAAWASKLDRNDEGAIKPTLHNMVLIIRNDPRTSGLMAFNQFTQEVAQRGTPGKKVLQKASPKGTKQLTGPIWVLRDPINGDLWTDDKDDAIRDMIESPIRQGGYAIKVSDRDLRAAVNIVAREQSFHPVREYLGGLVWDGVPRLDSLFVRFLGAADTAYSRSVARLALVAGVARVMQPGHKFDFAVILEGLQGKRKSTFIKILGKHWFSELEGDVHNQQQMVESMQGSWVMEIPELSGFGRADIRQIKSFISRTSDKVRLAYARRAQVFHRQCLLIGSTNDREYLRDDTGGRRFWPMLCEAGEIDTVAFAAEIDQVWAEAAAVHRIMREAQPHGDLPLYLTDPEAQAQALAIQEDRRVEGAEDALIGVIGAWLEGPETDPSGFADEDDLIGPAPRTETCLAAIWVECLHKDVASYGQLQAQQLGRAMKRVPGWYSAGHGLTRNHGKQRIFRRLASLCI